MQSRHIQEITRGSSAPAAVGQREPLRRRSQCELLRAPLWAIFQVTLFGKSAAQRSVQSVIGRQVMDGKVIGKAASNESVTHSHRAIVRGLRQGHATFNLQKYSKAPNLTM